MKEWFGHQKRGLVSKDLKRLHRTTRRQQWEEEDSVEQEGVPWNIHDSSLERLFSAGPDSKEDGFSGLGFTAEQLQQWVVDQQRDGKRIASVDVMGQTRAGVEAGVHRAHGWAMTSSRAKDFADESKTMMHVGNVFSAPPLRELLKTLDEERTKDATELGLIFFRPIAGIVPVENNKLAQAYLYEFVFRPLFERLTEGGLAFVSSESLTGMPMLAELIKGAEGIEVVANRTNTAFRLRKIEATACLPSIRDLSDERREELDTMFNTLVDNKEDAEIAALRNPLMRVLRRKYSEIKRSRRDGAV